MRPSGATPSSSRCRRCGCGRTSRATCCATWPPRRAPTPLPANGAEPGKILNEARGGDIAPNYFGVDTTPLFVLLAGAYYARTADLDFVARVVAGDLLGAELDRCVRRHRRRRLRRGARRVAAGRAASGWKSSPDSVFHADGRMAQGPLALCEVQGYVYGAKLGAARIARSLGEMPRAIALVEAAQALQARFNSDVLVRRHRNLRAGARRRQATLPRAHLECRATACSRASRMPSAAASVIAGFGDEQFFSGWGVRTVAESELRFNPMSYHNGVDLAARQFAAGRRRCPLRRQGLRAADPQRAVRGRAAFRPAAPAGAVLRLPAQGARTAAAVARGLFAAGGIRRRHLPAAAERAGNHHRRARPADRARASGDAGGHRGNPREESRGR